MSDLNTNINEDTISALATAGGIGAISVIRISGNNSFKITDEIFRGNKKIVEAGSHTIHYGKIIRAGKTIDDVLVSVFKNPNSYTGEDSVEISTHGSQFIVQQILKLLAAKGARPAEPGEFTKRAFLNGKIDLAQAEAVADVINSRTEAGLRGARNQLDGLLSKKVDSLREELINSTSLIELELDFAEEDLEFIQTDKILNQINHTLSEIRDLLSTYSFGKVIREGVNVALVGQTNVGKSSILNYILKEARAIVSPIPGTTRDVIREEVSIEGILFRFFDTAGIRITEDLVEKEGVLRSRKSVEESDLVIFVFDVEEGIDKELLSEIKTLTHEDRIIVVANKSDLNEKKYTEADVHISALTGSGMPEFFRIMKDLTLETENYSENSAVVSNIRHFEALKNAEENLEQAVNSVKSGMTGEFISVDLRNAINSLGEIIGTVTTDDILNNIFSSFCIGK